MRRAALILAVLVVAGGLVVLVSAAGGGHPSGYKVDAIFDDVAFLTSGQDVRIAGAKVGTVDSIKLTPQRKARVEMSVDGRFAPFRADADCTIQPQSLIGERYVNCTPGTPNAAPLRAANGQHSTVPIGQTHAPVDLDLIFATLNLPTRQRAAILIDALGAGLAGHGSDLNAAILRANPALQETRRVLAVLDANRRQLQQLITSSDTVLAALAHQKGRVADFVKQSANVLTATANNRGALSESIARLPALLSQARPTLTQLSSFARTGTPAAQQLEGAAPGLNQLLRELQRFAPDARPTISALGHTSDVVLKALPDVAPQVHRLRSFAAAAKPAGNLVATLFDSLQKSGTVEGLQNFVYYAAAATARYDTISHILPAYPIATACEVWAIAPAPGCDAHFSSAPGSSTAATRSHRSTTSSRATNPSSSTPAAPATGLPPATTTTSTPPPTTTQPAPQPPNVVSDLLRFLLK